MKSSRSVILATLCFGVLLAMPVLASDTVIYSGTDLWHTVADGRTFVEFSSDPIPADFFCLGSLPFTGKVGLRGVPIASDPPGALGNADTIIQRLDDAVFNEEGIARAHIQIKALHMVSIAPIETECGQFDVAVSLAGEQPIPLRAGMKIVRERENSGYFFSEFGINAKISFKPVDGWRPRVLKRSFTMHGDHPWAIQPGRNGVKRDGFALVDTDIDGQPDTLLPGTSNFAVGWGEGSIPLEGATTTESGGTHVVEAVQAASPISVTPLP
jgi:hypothetical protein